MNSMFSLPGISEKLGDNGMPKIDGYSVKYFKADLNEVSDVMTLQQIETQALKGDEIVLLDRDKFTFMEKMFIIVRYMEKES